MTILFVTDDPKRSECLIQKLAKFLALKTVVLSDFDAQEARQTSLMVVDIDLCDFWTLKQFRDAFPIDSSGPRRVFLTRGNSGAEPYQANALGARLTISANLGRSDTINLMKLVGECSTKQKDDVVPPEAAKTAREIGSLQSIIFDAVTTDSPLPKARVVHASEQLSETLRDIPISSWLDTVRQHHSYTYRHCMIVSGIAVAFAMQLGFSEVDVQRISIGALMHDLGKVKIPLEILDKPGKLTKAEREELNKHPQYGYEILLDDGQFSDEVLDMTLHHHEMLDGSGYPDGLCGAQISDPVRILTVVDIFSALMDRRSYKAAMPAIDAYQILLSMEGKLELAIVKAIEPIVIAAQSGIRMASSRSACAL